MGKFVRIYDEKHNKMYRFEEDRLRPVSSFFTVQVNGQIRTCTFTWSTFKGAYILKYSNDKLPDILSTAHILQLS